MVKAAGAVMTGFACGYLGLRMRISLKKRAVSLSDIYASLEILESEITFSVNRLKKAFARAGKSAVFAKAAENIESGGACRALCGAVDSLKGRLCLTEADCSVIKSLGASIGKTDAEDQIKHIRYAKTLIAAQIREADEEYKKYGRLYSSGGVLVGLFIITILI